MTQEEILSKVEELGPWFHCIDLGEGVLTKHHTVAAEDADHPVGTWRKIEPHLPVDLTGKTVLDVGCNAGFYSFEAKRRGAERVVAFDAQRRQIRQGLFVADVLELDVEFSRKSVYDLDPNDIGQFDVVLGLGLLYHCKNIVHALEALAAVTRDLLIIETAIFVNPPASDTVSPSLAQPEQAVWHGQKIHLNAYVENPVDAKEAVYNWFIPSTEFLRVQLERLGFSGIQTIDDEDRVILVCRKSEPYQDSATLGNLAAEIALISAPTRCTPDEQITFKLTARNVGWLIWRANLHDQGQRGTVSLGPHLMSGQHVTRFGFSRAHLDRDILPGQTADLSLTVTAPDTPGTYTIEFDMISEDLVWFEDLGSPIVRHEFTVK
ncbi:MAG TPA: DUF1698 domain-containing protein [Pyrinomonadaceae bacterium]|jgi:tRNA (mo5U34)-methyltransferase|nr:DUF1698 domain-containing protein [Pyrinomonadaceae bacterium]